MSEKQAQNQDADKEMTLTEHLRELTKRLRLALIGVVLGCGLAWGYSDILMDIIMQPIVKYLPQGKLSFTAITTPFTATIKLSLVAGAILTCPWWLYQLWMFISPALFQKEKKYAVTFLSIGTVLFLTGIVFSYYLALPAAFDFLMTFGQDKFTPIVTIDEHLSFFTIMILVFGVMFELPLVLTMLGAMGIIDQKFLRKHRRIAVVIMAVVAAVVTPTPDMLSMGIVLGPLIVLYELSILMMNFFKPSSTAR